MAQKTGALIFDETADRYDIRFDIADYYGGLHCGECVDVFTGGKWKPTRIEYGDNWYLVGTKHPKYKYLSDFDKKNAFDMEKHLRRRPAIVKPDEVFDYYEVDEADLQEDAE